VGSQRSQTVQSRRGATPLWLVVFLTAAGFAWAIAKLEASTAAAGYSSVDPRRVAFDLPAGDVGFPPGWNELVAAKLVRLGELSTLDEGLLDEVRAELEALPFVREVGEARVLWPDGVSVAIRLREPVACICLGEDYLPVASDGVVLPGYWASPPDFGRGLLPVIGPVDGTFRQARPGEALTEARHLDAVSVAISMREHLSLDTMRALGPVVIDATKAPQAAVDEPGTVLLLEDFRTVYFGRPPSYDAPGELPEAEKWRHLARAVDLLEPGAPKEMDWDLVDVRWDGASLRPRLGYQ